MSVSAKNIRNIAIVGHSGEGKTTLCEAILFNGGAIERMGRVDTGTTVSDFDEQEIARKMSVSLSAAYTTWKDVKINLLDCPGFYDFEGEVNEAMRACGAAIVVMGANGTLTVGAEKAINQCLRAKKPLIIFINGMDKDNADYYGTVRALQEKYKNKIAPIQIPMMEGNKMTGNVNALTEKAYRFTNTGPEEITIPDAYRRDFDEMRLSLTEAAAENDDVLLEKYFEDGQLSREDIIHGIRKGIYNINVIPVMAGSALQNKGVINLMNEIVKYLPEAAERAEVPATDLEKDSVIGITCDEDAPFAAQVFKTAVDPFVGKLNYLRVCRGVLKTGMTVLNPNTNTEERINTIYLVCGKKQRSRFPRPLRPHPLPPPRALYGGLRQSARHGRQGLLRPCPPCGGRQELCRRQGPRHGRNARGRSGRSASRRHQQEAEGKIRRGGRFPHPRHRV